VGSTGEERLSIWSHEITSWNDHLLRHIDQNPWEDSSVRVEFPTDVSGQVFWRAVDLPGNPYNETTCTHDITIDSSIDWPYPTPADGMPPGASYYTFPMEIVTGLPAGFRDGSEFLLNPIRLLNAGDYPVTLYDVLVPFKSDAYDLYPKNFTTTLTLDPGDAYYMQLAMRYYDTSYLVAETGVAFVVDGPDFGYVVFPLTPYITFFDTPADVPPDWDYPDAAPDPPIVRAAASIDNWVLY
jgi:hypothetical protein